MAADHRHSPRSSRGHGVAVRRKSGGYGVGAIEVDIDAELAQLGPTGYRPLRVRDTLF
ncbi:hypothetical protein [Nocardia barduliensis]|uniref:hypothetical protein n=1 Tax=Nocardia barduliensis TaxID=2736643 RepID=UPI0015724044|nr:hypothetical protein [Nocardia barduliensis]